MGSKLPKEEVGFSATIKVNKLVKTYEEYSYDHSISKVNQTSYQLIDLDINHTVFEKLIEKLHAHIDLID